MKYTSLPSDQFTSWAQLNGIQLHGITIKSNIKDENGNNKGGGLVALKTHTSGDVLLTVPTDLILSPSQIDEQARSDKHLRELLEAVGPRFSQNPRKKTLIFLLLQLTHSSPDYGEHSAGNSSPFTDYVQCLPKSIPLPTFLPPDQMDLLAGTSLFDALKQKLDSLKQEFDDLRESTVSISWCQRLWWDEDEGRLTMEDWKLVDAMYRSRVLDLPQVEGNAMVPVLDMANHGPEAIWNARFEADEQGNALLVVRDDRVINEGDEISIMYGAGGACEMIFSYGFLDKNMTIAREILLDLKMPDDDPLAIAKVRFSQQKPGVRIFHDTTGSVQWRSPSVWWACVNEEDGLAFDVVQTNDGGRELQASWKGAILHHSENLEELLKQDPHQDLFRLRANVLVQERVELQGQILSRSQEIFQEQVRFHSGLDLNATLNMIQRLRDVELNTLVACYQWFETEKIRLLGSDSVRVLLATNEAVYPDAVTDTEDFS